jgi:hypothetical protein
MPDPYVRILGEVTDMDGLRLGVGVDYDTVTIGRHQLTQAQAEEFARVFVSAVWQAGQQKARMDEEQEHAPPPPTRGPKIIPVKPHGHHG